jgi:hypothetical protein
MAADTASGVVPWQNAQQAAEGPHAIVVKRVLSAVVGGSMTNPTESRNRYNADAHRIGVRVFLTMCSPAGQRRMLACHARW